MLLPRILTALVLLAIFVPIVLFKSVALFLAVSALFLGAAIWECARLHQARPGMQIFLPFVAVALYLAQATGWLSLSQNLVYMLCLAIWVLRLAPALGSGLPPSGSARSSLLGVVFGLTVFGAFVALDALFQLSPPALLSALALVWIADIAAYFCGKAFGRRKLAPSISPGKSWEGAIGGAVSVLLAAGIMAWPGFALPEDLFPRLLRSGLGWPSMFSVALLVAILSVCGDLFESMLKRRAGFKDSSHLLPGHGGVLDRIDALIPVLPLAALLCFRLLAA